MADTAPHKIGSYRIERELGRGGMGIVYEVVHEVLGHHAAVKVLLPEVSRDAELLERFFNEARAATAIEHPSIVEIFDVGQSDGRAFIVMELLRGESLGTRLRGNQALAIERAVDLATQCAHALAAAHAAGIIHRDLKPDNIFLVPDDEGRDQVKLLDFGVAKLVDHAMATTARTMTGAILGTPHYMSPEQCEGAREVDHRSDLYSLGCVVFQMTTGRLPFRSDGVGGLIGMHLHVAPPLLRTLRPDAPAALERVIATLLAKSPDERYQSAEQVAGALAAVPVGEPGAAPPPNDVIANAATVAMPPASVDPAGPTRVSVVTRPPRRRVRAIVLVIAVLAVIAGVLVIVLDRDLKPSRAVVVAADAARFPDAVVVAVDPDLVEAQRRLADRDFDGAYARAVVVLESHPGDTAALTVRTAARRGRALASLDAIRAAAKTGDAAGVKRELDAVYADTEDRDPLREEADRVWAATRVKAIAAAEVAIRTAVAAGKCKDASKLVVVARTTLGAALGALVKDCEATVKQQQVTRASLLAEITERWNTGNLAAMQQPCHALLNLDPAIVPYERCVIAVCKYQPSALTIFMLSAPAATREQLQNLCPEGK